MKSNRARILAVAATGALALAGVAAAANADTSASTNTSTSTTTSKVDHDRTTITDGTTTMIMMDSYIKNMRDHNIKLPAQGNFSFVDNGVFTTTMWQNDLGDASLSTCSGSEIYNRGTGGMLVVNDVTGKALILTDAVWDVANKTVNFTWTPPTGGPGQVIPSLDLRGTRTGIINGINETYSASEMYIDPTAGALMDAYLDTTAFTDTQLFGAFSTSFSVSEKPDMQGSTSCH
jgi:hypothetical protein